MTHQALSFGRSRLRIVTGYPKLIQLLEGRLLLSIFFVSVSGNDANQGTSTDAPLRTIQQAVNLAMPGDTVLVRGGTYRETVTTPRSGTEAARITIRNYEEELVIVSGTDPIAGEWTPVGGEVYCAPMAWNYHFENERPDYNSNQVFHGGQMMELARWPDQTSADPVRPTIAVADSVTFSKSDPSLKDNDLTTFHEADFNEGLVRWVGAKIWVNLSRNGTDGQGQTGTVVETTAGSITVTGIDTRGGNGAWGIGEGTEFYLFAPTAAGLKNSGGIAAAVGRGEWFIDPDERQIYVRTPSGAAPAAGSIEAKRRTYGFNFDGDGYVTLQGINLFGTALTTDDLAGNRNAAPGGVAAANDILIDSMNARYITHFTDQTGNYQMQWLQKSGLILSGANITFQNAEVRYSAGAGLSVFGRQNKVLNSVFRDLNLSVSEAGMVNFGKTYDPGNVVVVSEDHEFGYNTLYNSPQQGINFRALKNSTNNPRDVRARIHHNLIHDVMLRSFDSAAIDSCGVDHQYVRIDHNVIYNLQGGSKFGVYFDFALGGIIDHNMVYNVTRPFNINWNPSTGKQNIWILNNVGISDLEEATAVSSLSPESGGSIIRNNIWAGPAFTTKGATISHNIPARDELFVNAMNQDMAARNYQLRRTASDAIDMGVSVPPYDDRQFGKPDIGAYEFGVEPWAGGAGKLPTKLSN